MPPLRGFLKIFKRLLRYIHALLLLKNKCRAAVVFIHSLSSPQTLACTPVKRRWQMKQLNPLRSINHRLSEIYAEERTLFGLGLLGIALGIVGLIVMAVRGRIIPPEGYIYKAASFDIAIGIYILTIILFVPLAGFSQRGRRVWRWASVALALYAYAAENIQIYRGLDPRFTRFGSTLDNIIGTLFGLTALGLIATFLILMWRFFTSRTSINGSLLLLGIRYGCAAVILGFMTGIWLGINSGPTVGATGNLLPLHAAGFHGLQAVPLVALLLGWSRMSHDDARLWVHLAGLAWLGVCGAIAWQTALGRSVLEGSPATLLAVALLLVWLLCAMMALVVWRRADYAVRYSA
jgi:hypothetical protein